MLGKLNTKKINRFLFILLALIPVFLGLGYALLYSLGIIGFLNEAFSFKAWKTLLFDISFWKSLLFSLYVGVVSIGLALLFSLTIAISWRKQLQKGALATLIYLPLCFPATVMAFFCYQLLAKSGLLSRIGFSFEIIGSLSNFPEWINDAYGIGIIITMILLVTPFFIILFTQLFQSEKLDSYINLAATLGASKAQIMKRVVLPVLLKKAAVTISLFVLFVMGNYEVPLLLGRQNPQMISVAIVQKIQRFNLLDIPQGYAMGVFYVLLIIVFLLFLYFKNPQFFKSENTDD